MVVCIKCGHSVQLTDQFWSFQASSTMYRLIHSGNQNTTQVNIAIVLHNHLINQRWIQKQKALTHSMKCGVKPVDFCPAAGTVNNISPRHPG